MPEEMQPEVDPAAEGGQVTEASEGVVEETGPSYFDPSEFADRVARVKVDGEEIEVPVPELLSGYSRTADYTRKQQALATERQQMRFAAAIADALQEDPQRAIEGLMNHYGYGQGAETEEDEFLDPLERQVREQGNVISQLTAERASQQLERDVAMASQQYGDLVDPHEAVSYAYSRGWTGPRAIHDAFAAVAGQKLVAQRAAEGQLAADRSATDAQIVQSKRDAQVIETSVGAVRGATSDQGPASSVREAYFQAKRELGVS